MVKILMWLVLGALFGPSQSPFAPQGLVQAANGMCLFENLKKFKDSGCTQEVTDAENIEKTKALLEDG